MDMDLLWWIAIFVLSLFGLVKASDFFTAAAEKIGLMLGISPFVVGVTIVSIGTSLPELISSIVAVLHHSSEIVAGNVVGSNIANIFLILAIGAIMAKRLRIRQNLLPVDLPILIGSALFFGLTVMDNEFTFWEAVLFVICILLFFTYTVKDSKAKSEGEKSELQWQSFLILLVSAVGVYFGATYTIESITRIAEILVIGKEIIAVTAVAIGTSLPELAVTFAAVKKKNAGIIVGNVLGSNIFNTFAVMGIPGLLGTLEVSDVLLYTGVPVMIVASILFFVVIVDKKMSRWEGSMFIIFYVYFMMKIFNWV